MLRPLSASKAAAQEDHTAARDLIGLTERAQPAAF